MQIKSDRIVFPDNTEQFTAGGGSGGGSTLESLGIPNHDQVTVTESGNTGIGGSPADLGGTNFHVKSDNIASVLAEAQGRVATFQVNSASDIVMGARSNHNLRLVTNDTERMKIDANGNVVLQREVTSNVGHDLKTIGLKTDKTAGIFNSWSSAFYNSSGATPTYSQIRMKVDDASVGAEKGSISFWNMQSGALTEHMKIDANGRVDITGSLYVNGSAISGGGNIKAWVNFAGNAATPTPISGSNVTSITDQGVGMYRLNFTTAMADANYCAVGMCRRPSANDAHIMAYRTGTTNTTTQCHIATFEDNGTRQDPQLCSVMIVR